MNAQAALKSSDPKQRFNAVKQIAKDKDRSMLNILMDMAANDPNDQVREVAQRAVAYIQSDGKAGGKARPPRKEVTAKEKARAKQYVDAAIGYQINGERDKALRELAKALKINPDLESEPFFKSVLEDVSGQMGEEALVIVRDPEQLQAVQGTERKLKQEKRKQEHMKDVRRSTWGSVTMDLLIYTLITTFATIFLIVLLGQVAQGYVNGVAAAQQAYLNGELKEAPEIDPQFYQYGQEFSALSWTFGAIVGVIGGIASLISLLIQLLFTHLAARFIFGGQATLPHLIYKVVSYYNGRLPILYAILFVAVVGSFAVGGGILPIAGSLALALFSLNIFFKTIGRIGETYDFGAAKGCLSLLVGSIIVGVISFAIQLAFYGSIAAMLANQLGPLPNA